MDVRFTLFCSDILTLSFLITELEAFTITLDLLLLSGYSP